MELTTSWADVMPQQLLDRYEFAETRNAAMIMQATQPEQFNELCHVLDNFFFDVDRILRSGKSKHLIPLELDEAFRELGWREGRYDQELTTTLTFFPYRGWDERGQTRRQTVNEYGGHKIDNIKGRVGLDVEWNPKDGNLDRDLNNFRALYDGGALDLGVILTRTGTGMRELWSEVIARGKELTSGSTWSGEWQERIAATPDDPLATSTTSNFEKLEPRIKRGDGGGCPILAIAITPSLFFQEADIDTEILNLAHHISRGGGTERLAQRLGLVGRFERLATDAEVEAGTAED